MTRKKKAAPGLNKTQLVSRSTRDSQDLFKKFKQHVKDLDASKMSVASQTSNQELQSFYNRNMSTKLSRGKAQPPDYLQQFKPET